MNGTNSTFSTSKSIPTNFDEMLDAVEKIRGLPAQKWMLIAPDGRIWSDVDPIKLIAPIYQDKTSLVNFV